MHGQCHRKGSPKGNYTCGSFEVPGGAQVGERAVVGVAVLEKAVGLGRRAQVVLCVPHRSIYAFDDIPSEYEGIVS